MELKQVKIKDLIEKEIVNKSNYPDTINKDKNSKLSNVMLYGCKWFGIYINEKLIVLVQIKKQNKTLFVKTLEVDKSIRAKGYGSKMLEEMAKYGKEKGYENIELIPMNENLINFYKKNGFRQIKNSKKMFKTL